MTDEELGDELYEAHRRCQGTSAERRIAMAREARRLIAPHACRWEADHQREALQSLGLADEFPWGCDAIEHVGESLISARKQRDTLRSRVAELEADQHRRRPELAIAQCVQHLNRFIGEHGVEVNYTVLRSIVEQHFTPAKPARRITAGDIKAAFNRAVILFSDTREERNIKLASALNDLLSSRGDDKPQGGS